MNAEQKQRAIKLITYWRNRSITTMPEECFVSGDCMTDLLQELIDAPEPEPVAYQVMNGWVNIALYERQIDAENYAKDQQKRHDLSGSIAHFCVVPLYTAPPANNQSEQHLEMVNAPAPSVPDVDLVRDAERYRWLRDWTRGAYGIDSNPAFILPHVPTMLDQNIMSGSVAQHLDNAIDAAIERDKLKGGAP